MHTKTGQQAEPDLAQTTSYMMCSLLGSASLLLLSKGHAHTETHTFKTSLDDSAHLGTGLASSNAAITEANALLLKQHAGLLGNNLLSPRAIQTTSAGSFVEKCLQGCLCSSELVRALCLHWHENPASGQVWNSRCPPVCAAIERISGLPKHLTLAIGKLQLDTRVRASNPADVLHNASTSLTATRGMLRESARLILKQWGSGLKIS
jgi:hypothetical protein